ncbi:GNAT family N-acetyltransferase [Pseudonocardia saturnea]
MPNSWSTRVEADADIAAVREIALAAFDTAAEADLVDALRDDPGWLPGLSLVSTDPDGAPVGYALLTRCHVGDVPALCLAPCAVLPRFQRTGAGSAAITAGLAAARAMGERFVVVLGHPTYYPRFGFGRASAHGISLSIEVPDEALMALSLDDDPLPGGQVRYAAPFGI